jgi:cytochrome c553
MRSLHCQRRNRRRIRSIRHGSNVVARWRSKTTATSATVRIFPGSRQCHALADQREDYLLKILRDYKSGTRHAYEPIMLEQVQPVDDPQLVEVSYYLAK